jgi:hypothetical protein
MRPAALTLWVCFPKKNPCVLDGQPPSVFVRCNDFDVPDVMPKPVRVSRKPSLAKGAQKQLHDAVIMAGARRLRASYMLHKFSARLWKLEHHLVPLGRNAGASVVLSDMRNCALRCAQEQDGERGKSRGIKSFALCCVLVRSYAKCSERIKRPLLYH